MNTSTAQGPIEPRTANLHDWALSCARAGTRGFPPRHTTAILDKRTQLDDARTEAWNTLREAVIDRGLVLMTGPNGHGKTHMVTLLGVMWDHRGYPGEIRYWPANDLIGAQMRWFDRKRDGDGRVIESPDEIARRAGLLVLDQLNELRSGSEYSRTSFVALIDHRYRAGLPTVLVTNQTAEHVFDSVLGGDMERIKEGGCVIVCEWDNYRDRMMVARNEDG